MPEIPLYPRTLVETSSPPDDSVEYFLSGGYVEHRSFGNISSDFQDE